MARFEGFFPLGLEDLSGIPEEVIRDMLLAMTEVVEKAQKEELQSQEFPYGTGELIESLGHVYKKGGIDTHYVLVYPQGVREDGTSNAEVGFIREYGAPLRGIPPKPWMRPANDKALGDAVAASERVYEKWLKSVIGK